MRIFTFRDLTFRDLNFSMESEQPPNFNRNNAVGKRNTPEMIFAQPGSARQSIANIHDDTKEIEMNKLKTIYTLAFAAVLAGTAAGCADFRAHGSESAPADAMITADVETRLNQMADLGPPGSIKVQTLDHVVYLNGLVDVGVEKRTAEEAALEVPGVAKVADDIDVLHN